MEKGKGKRTASKAVDEKTGTDEMSRERRIALGEEEAPRPAKQVPEDRRSVGAVKADPRPIVQQEYPDKYPPASAFASLQEPWLDFDDLDEGQGTFQALPARTQDALVGTPGAVRRGSTSNPRTKLEEAFSSHVAAKYSDNVLGDGERADMYRERRDRALDEYFSSIRPLTEAEAEGEGEGS